MFSEWKVPVVRRCSLMIAASHSVSVIIVVTPFVKYMFLKRYMCVASENMLFFQLKSSAEHESNRNLCTLWSFWRSPKPQNRYTIYELIYLFWNHKCLLIISLGMGFNWYMVLQSCEPQNKTGRVITIRFSITSTHFLFEPTVYLSVNSQSRYIKLTQNWLRSTRTKLSFVRAHSWNTFVY